MTQSPAEIPQTTHDALPDNAALLDVREADEWEAGRAPGAVHIPLSELPQRLSELPEGRPLVVTCKAGGRSARAVAFLRSQDIDAVNLDGGMLAWQAANRPMTHDGAGTPSVA